MSENDGFNSEKKPVGRPLSKYAEDFSPECHKGAENHLIAGLA